MAVALSVLTRSGGATHWQSWDAPPPGRSQRFGRHELVQAMWRLFGTTPGALLNPHAPLMQELNHPNRVLLDLLFDPREALTLVANHRLPGPGSRDSAKVSIDSPDWIWSAEPLSAIRSTKLAEYNPVNTLNQQNGIGCAWPADDAAQAIDEPQEVYAVPRSRCVNLVAVPERDPLCRLNNKACAGTGEGTARAITKPRLLAPAFAGDPGYLVLPGTIEALVAQATRNGNPLPRARDLSLMVSWCAANGTGNLDANRLIQLLGPPSMRLLTSTS